jgi:hypothetical protein
VVSIPACHAGNPGSIPGLGAFFFFFLFFRNLFKKKKKKKEKCGGAGYRSLCLMHAKHALYHLSYTPTTYLFFLIHFFLSRDFFVCFLFFPEEKKKNEN